MKNRLIRILGALAFGGMLIVPCEAFCGELLIGGTLSVTVDDTPIGSNFSGNVTLQSGTTTLPGIDMTLTQSIYTVSSNTQWLVLDFEATNGQLLAGNQGGFWEIGTTLPLAIPSGFTGVFGYFSVNGAPTNPINGFGSGFISDVGTDPVNSTISPVYVQASFPSPLASGTSSLPLPTLIEVGPYSEISAGGMDPTAVNGFVLGLKVTASAVPEPSSLCLLATASAAIAGSALVRRKLKPRPA
jgi:hypothetical protein